jgi:hypothetical protein
MEIWIKIDKQYSISSFGNVKNDKTDKMLKPSKKSSGYLSVCLYKKTKLIHRLMIPFLENLNNYECVDHIDRNRLNNNISNLRMVSRSENNRNKTKKQNTLSQYVGVTFDKRTQKWMAQCKINKKTKHIGRFDTEYDAGLAFNEYCIQNGLNTANLNILTS